MNSKMTTYNYQQLNLKNKNKNKLSKQLEQEQNQRNGDHRKVYQWGEERGNGEKGTGNKKHNQQVQSRQAEVKNSIGNGETKELICMTPGHELRVGNAGGRGDTEQRGIKGRKKWDNCDSIIYKIYFKKGKMQKLLRKLLY